MTTERPRRRRKVALNSRIAASGLAACATFAMVTGMALVGAADEDLAAAPAPPPAAVAPVTTPARPAPEIIIVQRRYIPVGGGTGSSSGTVSSTSSSSGSSSVSSDSAAPAPAPAPPPTSSGGS